MPPAAAAADSGSRMKTSGGGAVPAPPQKTWSEITYKDIARPAFLNVLGTEFDTIGDPFDPKDVALLSDLAFLKETLAQKNCRRACQVYYVPNVTCDCDGEDGACKEGAALDEEQIRAGRLRARTPAERAALLKAVRFARMTGVRMCTNQVCGTVVHTTRLGYEVNGASGTVTMPYVTARVAYAMSTRYWRQFGRDLTTQERLNMPACLRSPEPRTFKGTDGKAHTVLSPHLAAAMTYGQDDEHNWLLVMTELDADKVRAYG